MKRHLLFKNRVETTKEVVLPTLPRILRHKVSWARNLGLSTKVMEHPDLEKL